MGKKSKKPLIIFLTHWFLIITTSLFLACSQTNFVENVKDDAVVAVINGNDIAVKDLKNEINLLMRQFRIKNLNDLTQEEKLILKTKLKQRQQKHIVTKTGSRGIAADPSRPAVPPSAEPFKRNVLKT